MYPRKHKSKFTQNYPTEREDYESPGREPAEGGEDTIEQALRQNEILENKNSQKHLPTGTTKQVKRNKKSAA